MPRLRISLPLLALISYAAIGIVNSAEEPAPADAPTPDEAGPQEPPAESADAPLEPAPAAEGEPLGETAAEDGEVKRAFLADFTKDPTLGGKLHLTYQASLGAKFFRYHPYVLNFPADATVDDLQTAAELEARHRERRRDLDFDQYLAIRTYDLFLPSQEDGFLQGVDTEASVRWFNDLDGSPTGDEAQSTYDSLDGRERLQVRTLNARLKLLDRHLELRGGRMYIEGAEWLFLDGAEATAKGLALFGLPFEVTGFAGARVSFFETVSRTTVWGGAFRIWPWGGGRIELADAYFLENTFQARFDQRLGEWGTTRLTYRQIDEDPQSLAADLQIDGGESGWTLWLEYFGKFGLQAKDFVFDYTSLTQASARDRQALRYFNLGDLDPFDEASGEARWAWTDRIGLLAGATAHIPRGSSHRDEFNTEWYEVWGGFDTSHVPWDGFTTRTVARYMHADLPRRKPATVDPFLVQDVEADGEPSFFGVELLIEQDLARRVALGATAEFRLYKYDSRFAHLDQLLGLGATAYARFRQNRFLTYSILYAYDRDFEFVNPDFEEVHGVRAEMVFSF